MEQAAFLRHKLKNTLQSLILIISLSGLCALLAWFIGGLPMAFATALAILISYKINPVASPEWAMRLFRARKLTPNEAPDLYRLLTRLTQRAGLDQALSPQAIGNLLAHTPYRPRWHRNGMWY
jgi:heat shock protein HtpX